jgi:hypothetical protein
MQKASTAALQARADARAADVAPVISELQAAGAASLQAIADGLNAKKIPTARGDGEWTSTQVMRVMERPALSRPPQAPQREGLAALAAALLVGLGRVFARRLLRE